MCISRFVFDLLRLRRFVHRHHTAPLSLCGRQWQTARLPRLQPLVHHHTHVRRICSGEAFADLEVAFLLVIASKLQCVVLLEAT